MLCKTKRAISLALSVLLPAVVCLSGIVLPAAASSSPAGLLPSGDFETELTSGWTWGTSSAAPTYAIVNDSGSPMTVIEDTDGNHCLQIPEKIVDGVCKIYDKYYLEAPVEGGKTYRLSMKYKGTGLRVYIHTAYTSAGGGGFSPPAQATEWTEFAVEFTTNEILGTTNFIFAIGHTAAAGTAYIDDVCLNEVIKPTGIALPRSQITMGVGGVNTLTLTAQPEGASMPEGPVIWTSSNTAVATVDADGTVTAVAPGVTYITAALGSYTAVATVIVDPYIPSVIGDFEGTLSSGWTWSSEVDGIVNSSSPMTVYTESDGNNCLKIPSTGAVYTRYYQSCPVEAGKTYTLSFRYKGTGLRLYIHSSNCTTGGGAPTIAASDDWTVYRHTFTVSETMTNTNLIFGIGHTAASGTAYIDDVMLGETAPYGDLLIGGDFEASPLPSNWSNFEAAAANIAFVPDPADADNTCMQITGTKRCNYTGLSAAKADTTYKLTFRGKGSERFAFDFVYGVSDTQIVIGSDNYTVTGTRVYIFPDSATEWNEYSIIFTTKSSINNNYIFYAGGLDATGLLYMDDISLTELGVAHAFEYLSNGSVTLSVGSTTDTVISGLGTGTAVTATVTPDEGYLMVPGSLRYTTTGGITKRILNKDGGFGEGDGNTFTFTMPQDSLRIFADFVKSDSTDFAWGTVGTAVRYAAGGTTTDGIRFLTRVNMAAFDAAASGFTLKYEDDTYTVKELGLMLKRADNESELTYENALSYGEEDITADQRIWRVAVYTAASDTFRLTDYTAGYIDYTIAMTTSNPSEAFNSRSYTARGYLILEKEGIETVLYAGERTDSVNTALARANGELSDTPIDVPDTGSGGNTSGGEGGGTVTESPIPEDDKDYTNADLKILSIGNSYSQDAQGYLSKIADAEGKTFKTVNLYKSGCALQTHYNGWVNNEAIYNYELNGVTNYNEFVSLKAVLESDDFDIITLQQASWSSVSYSTYQPYLNDLIAVIHEKQPNATIYIHQTWAYGDANANHASRPDVTGGTMAAMWTKIEAAYNSAASETGLSLIPSGQAIQLAQETLNAGGYSETSIQRDSSHVSFTWGRYLLARVWYQMFTGEVPTVTLDKLNTSVTADEAMESLVAEAVAAAFSEYAADPVTAETEAAT